MEQGHARFDARRDARARRGRPHARHGLHRRRPPHHRGAAAQAAEPDVLGDDAARDRASWPTRSWSTRSSVAVTPVVEHRRAGRAVGAHVDRSRQARAAARGAARSGDDARAGVHAHQARRQPGRRAARPQRRRAPTRSTATSRRAPASARWTRSSAAACACWSRPTSRRAASTSTASRTSSTSSCPNEPESYVHRIGRTARAGASGVALSFCDREERGSLRAIERLTRTTVRVVGDHPFARPRSSNGRGFDKREEAAGGKS